MQSSQIFIKFQVDDDKKISDFVAYYLGKTLEERLDYKAKVSNFHNKRSMIVHQNSFANTVNYKEYLNLLAIVKQIIYKMYSNLSTIKTKEELKEYIKKIKYS